LLVANDLNPARVKALVKNIELCGVRNAIVTNETPGKLAAKFTGYFDKILVDAPCSGEGMFRKDKSAIRSWERYKSKDFSVIQEDILESAEKMLKPGGRIVYSTCTFSPGENEEVISSFLERNENYELLEIPLPEGTERGRPEWADGDERMKKCVRFWPHKARGEGHFIALLGKKGHGRDPGRISPGLNASLTENQNKYCLSSVEIRDFPGKIRGNTKKLMDNYREIFAEFVNKNLNAEIGELGLCLEGNRRSLHKNLSIEIRDQLLLIGDNLYWLPVHLPDLDGIKVVRFGWHLGRFKKSSSMRTSNTDNMLEHMFEYMFEPSQAMIMPLEKGDLKRVVDFPPDSMEIIRYLKGETLLIEGEKGIIGVCMDGYTVGWAKQTGKEMKNLYPPGWRWIPSEN
jgi:NOL1/NOP2/fmu family ribosome biogenesis protein